MHRASARRPRRRNARGLPCRRRRSRELPRRRRCARQGDLHAAPLARQPSAHPEDRHRGGYCRDRGPGPAQSEPYRPLALRRGNSSRSPDARIRPRARRPGAPRQGPRSQSLRPRYGGFRRGREARARRDCAGRPRGPGEGDAYGDRAPGGDPAEPEGRRGPLDARHRQRARTCGDLRRRQGSDHRRRSLRHATGAESRSPQDARTGGRCGLSLPRIARRGARAHFRRHRSEDR